jgi:hypothetical protein
MKRPRAGRLKTVLVVIGCVIALPVIVPYVLIANAFADRRRKLDAEKQTCSQCGNVFGQVSIAKADEYWRAVVSELHTQFPGARFRLVRDVWAICSVCGAHYNYRVRDNTFILKLTQVDASVVAYEK